MADLTRTIPGTSLSGNGSNGTAANSFNDTHQNSESLTMASGPNAATTATMTLTTHAQQTTEGGAGSNNEVLRLTLRSRPNVTWDENVIDNEGLGRKSSKRCCIFHKQRAFGESSTDSSDYESDDNDNRGDHRKPIARKKNSGNGTEKKKTPDHLRFH